MNIPLFSVLIANHNNGRYLQEAVDSVVQQAYTNWEIVIVDDGSTDNSHDVYKALKQNSKIRIYTNDKNMGCGYSKRRCIELAQGDLCGFLDADDVLLPNALKDHVEVHVSQPAISCCFSRFYHCDTELNTLKKSRLLKLPGGSTYLEHKDYGPEHMTSFKKGCYDKTAGISTQLPAAVDQDLYFKLEEVAPVYILDKFTYKYRTTPKQISQGENWSRALSCNLQVRLDACKRRGITPVNIFGNDLYEVLPLILQELDNTQETLSRIQTSKAYRLGKLFLHLNSLFKK